MVLPGGCDAAVSLAGLFIQHAGTTPHLLSAIESIHWLYGALGLGYSYLNRPYPWIQPLSKAVLPVYIIHMAVLYTFDLLILPLHIHAVYKLVLISGLTVLGCFIAYDFMIRRFRVLQPCFGMISRETAAKADAGSSPIPA